MKPTSAVLEYPVGGFRMAVRVGSIAERAGQVTVVASDDNYLSHGGGSSRAIWSALGDVLSTDPAVVRVRQGQRPDAGDVVVSRVAPGVSVLHAITLDFDRGSRVTSRELVALYQRSLDIVLEEGGAVVALPILGAGAARVPPGESIAALLEAVHERSVLPMSCEVEVWTPEDAAASDAAAVLARAARPRVRYQDLAPEAPAGLRELLDEVDAATRTTLVSAAVRLFTALTEGSGRSRADARDMALAWQARNKLVRYQSNEAEIPLVCEVLRWCRLALTDADPTLAANGADSRRRSGTAAAGGGVRAADFVGHEAAGAAEVGGSGGAPRGTQHVRNLHALLMRELSDDALATEHDRLRALGYRGTAELCLLESCAHDQPDDVLLHHLSGSRLIAILRESDIPFVLAESPALLAQRLLHHLGFPVRSGVSDPQSLLTEIEVARSEVPRLDSAGLRGRVTGISQGLEGVLRLYATFLALGVLHVAPDKWLAARQPGVTLERSTLGGLVHLVRDLGAGIVGSDDARVRALLMDLQQSGRAVVWMPKRALSLVHSRNVWVHGDVGPDVRSRPLAELSRDALEFFAAASEILAELLEGPFPRVLVVDEVTYDRWGRRRVTGRTALGATEEIFTDEDLRMGQAYVMFSVTNPLHVDPVLLPLSPGAVR